MTKSLLERTAALPASAYYLSKESNATLKNRAAEIHQELAAKRAKKEPTERRKADRRTGEFDRREGDRRQESKDRRTFATMKDKLAAVHDKREKGDKFDGSPPSGFLPFGDD
jgi:hypothetical protein